MSKPANTARRDNACMKCGCAPILGRRLDGTGERAVYWCTRCEHVAFGGDSFAPGIHGDALAALPIVGKPRQGNLL